ncbi:MULTISPECIES: hypothetical protein [unclassified Endozoicomonas]|uniref:hypothetical protein n=1 Tax=unclassified Endozoicomonas TaxID=2644528 RepID=UPI0021481341|nr:MULTISPECIES: hypothetical protein [unclassified Endozoicomonas]
MSIVKLKGWSLKTTPTQEKNRYSLNDDTDKHNYLIESSDGFSLQRQGNVWSDGQRTYDADKDSWPRDDYGDTLTGMLKPKRVNR